MVVGALDGDVDVVALTGVTPGSRMKRRTSRLGGHLGRAALHGEFGAGEEVRPIQSEAGIAVDGEILVGAILGSGIGDRRPDGACGQSGGTIAQSKSTDRSVKPRYRD